MIPANASYALKSSYRHRSLGGPEPRRTDTASANRVEPASNQPLT